MAEHTSAPARLVAGLSPLDQLEACLRLLCTGPAPLALDGRRIGHGLPRRPIRCDELAAVLAHPSCGHEAKRKVWARLVARARSGDSGWVVACCGVALPGLRRAAARLAYAPSRADVDADLLAGFLTALATVDTRASGVCGRLVNAALIHARGRLREQQAAAAGESRSVPGSAVPRPPVGHPDLVLARAVQLEVITAFEAELIGDTRLEETTVADWADRNQLSRKACPGGLRPSALVPVEFVGRGGSDRTDACGWYSGAGIGAVLGCVHRGEHLLHRTCTPGTRHVPRPQHPRPPACQGLIKGSRTRRSTWSRAHLEILSRYIT